MPSICLEDGPFEELEERLGSLLRQASDSMEEELRVYGEFCADLIKKLEDDVKKKSDDARQAYSRLAQRLDKESFADIPPESRETLLRDLQHAFKGAWYRVRPKRGLDIGSLVQVENGLEKVDGLFDLVKVESEAGAGPGHTKYDEFVVTISYCVSPNEFYFQRLCDADKRAAVCKALHRSRVETFPIPDVVEEGGLYAVADEGKMEWLRGRRLKKFGSYVQGNGPAVDVYTFLLVDEGRMVKQHVPYVRLLPENLLSIQELALLSSLQPTLPGCPILWKPSETEKFKRLVGNGKLLSMKVYTDEAGLTKTDFGQIPNYADEPHIVSIANALLFARGSAPSETAAPEKIRTYECRIKNSPGDQRFDATVIKFYDPYRFYVKLRATEGQDIYEKMEKDIQDLYNNPENLALRKVRVPQKGQAYAVRIDQTWYRATAESITADRLGVCAFLVDCGTQHRVSVGELYHMDDRFMAFAAQAIKCKLDSVFPKAGSRVKSFTTKCNMWLWDEMRCKSVSFFVEHVRSGTVRSPDGPKHDQMLAITLFVEKSQVSLNALVDDAKLAYYYSPKTGYSRIAMLKDAAPSQPSSHRQELGVNDGIVRAGPMESANGVALESIEVAENPEESLSENRQKLENLDRELSSTPLDHGAIADLPPSCQQELGNEEGAMRPEMMESASGVAPESVEEAEKPDDSLSENLENGDHNATTDLTSSYDQELGVKEGAAGVVPVGVAKNPKESELAARVYSPSAGEVEMAVTLLNYDGFQDIYLRHKALEAEYRGMMASLQDDYKTMKIDKSRYRVGHRCVVKRDGEFYRAELVKGFRHGHCPFLAKLVDIGSCYKVPRSSIYELREPYDKLKPFSFHASLFGVYHLDTNGRDGSRDKVLDWLSNSEELFFWSSFPNTPSGETDEGVLIYRCQSGGSLEVAGELDINLNEKLIAEGLARKIPCDPGPKKKPTSWLKDQNKIPKEFEAHLTWLNSDFELFMHSSKKKEALVKMDKRLQKMFRGCDQTERDKHCKVGDMCSARYGCDWYRATITERKDEEGMVRVQLEDYGGLEYVPSDDIRKKAPFHDAPIFAIKCTIYGIRPSAADSEEEVWSDEIIESIYKLLCGKKVQVLVRVPGAVPQVSLKMEDGVDVADMIVSKGLARYTK